MTAICFKALVLLWGKVVHEDPEKKKRWSVHRGSSQKKNALEIVFGLALPRELSRVVVVGHRGKHLIFGFGFLFHGADRPLDSCGDSS
jgi:hypothetical protein